MNFCFHLTFLNAQIRSLLKCLLIDSIYALLRNLAIDSSWYIKNELEIGFRVQSALNPILEIEHSLDLEHFRPSTGQVP